MEDGWKHTLTISLGSLSNEDNLIWHYIKNGHFLVRSAYYIALRLDELNISAPNYSSNHDVKGCNGYMASFKYLCGGHVKDCCLLKMPYGRGRSPLKLVA